MLPSSRSHQLIFSNKNRDGSRIVVVIRVVRFLSYSFTSTSYFSVQSVMVVMSQHNLKLLKYINKLVDGIYIWTYIAIYFSIIVLQICLKGKVHIFKYLNIQACCRMDKKPDSLDLPPLSKRMPSQPLTDR